MRRRGQDRHHYQAPGSGIANRMNDARRSKCRITGRKKFALLADLHHAAALQDEIEFVLSRMGMQRVLLAGLEGVEAGEEKVSLRYRALEIGRASCRERV